LQNNNLNFNSLPQVSQFKETAFKNNLNLITPKDAIPTKEAISKFRFDHHNPILPMEFSRLLSQTGAKFIPVSNFNSFDWSQL
jgi:hypothetical protein